MVEKIPLCTRIQVGRQGTRRLACVGHMSAATAAILSTETTPIHC